MSSEAELEARRSALISERARRFPERPDLAATIHQLTAGQGNAAAVVKLSDWNAAHPEAVALDAQITAVDEALAALAKGRQSAMDRDAALACLDECPRIRATVAAGVDRTEAVMVLEEFATSNAWCLLLLGGVGCGKSTAVGEFLFKEQLRVGPRKSTMQRALWVCCDEISRLSRFGPEADERFERLRKARALVLDDLGTEVSQPGWEQDLSSVMNARYQHSARTIITSNLPVEEFKRRYGERLVDRIRENGLVRQLGGESMRRPLDRRLKNREGPEK